MHLYIFYPFSPQKTKRKWVDFPRNGERSLGNIFIIVIILRSERNGETPVFSVGSNSYATNPQENSEIVCEGSEKFWERKKLKNFRQARDPETSDTSSASPIPHRASSAPPLRFSGIHIFCVYLFVCICLIFMGENMDVVEVELRQRENLMSEINFQKLQLINF